MAGINRQTFGCTFLNHSKFLLYYLFIYTNSISYKFIYGIIETEAHVLHIKLYIGTNTDKLLKTGPYVFNLAPPKLFNKLLQELRLQKTPKLQKKSKTFLLEKLG